jgi:hypothetical protein
MFWNSLKWFPEKSWYFLEKMSKICWRAEILYEWAFKWCFQSFLLLKISEVHFGASWKKLLVRNMWKVYTRLTSASDFFYFTTYWSEILFYLYYYFLTKNWKVWRFLAEVMILRVSLSKSKVYKRSGISVSLKVITYNMDWPGLIPGLIFNRPVEEQ